MRVTQALKRSFTILLLLSGASLYALGDGPPTVALVGPFVPAGVSGRDSLLPVRYNNRQNEQVGADLLDAEAVERSTGDSRKTFTRLLKIWGRWNSIRDTRIRARLFNDLAGVSAKLKLYPLAMKCYYKAVREPVKWRYEYPELITGLPDSLSDVDSMMGGTSAQQWTYADTIAGPWADPGSVVLSLPVAGQDVRQSFNDGKAFSFYALLVHVKQPVPGKRKSYTHINNVGHMFITLIKYNRDNSFVCRSFGFYPKKATIVSATPLHPGSASTFKDDALHDWDEVAGKFITARTFQKVLAAMAGYDGKAYHLNRNNCTDFGLTMARIGGISIADAAGRWPLGRGNNPGNAGQSMLEGKISNIDSTYSGPLFVSAKH